MHEAFVAQEIVRAVEEALASRPGFRATAVFVVIGPYQCVDPGSLAFAFEVVAAASPVTRDARLVVETASEGEDDLVLRSVEAEGPEP